MGDGRLVLKTGGIWEDKTLATLLRVCLSDGVKKYIQVIIWFSAYGVHRSDNFRQHRECCQEKNEIQDLPWILRHTL